MSDLHTNFKKTMKDPKQLKFLRVMFYIFIFGSLSVIGLVGLVLALII